MDAEKWNERYRETDALWSREPNRWLVAEVADIAPGRALDLGSGEGRNAIWLAEQGWEVDAVDFAPTAVERARARALAVGEETGAVLPIRFEVDDVLTRELPAASYDLVLLSYVHVESYDRRELVRRCAAAVAPGGMLLVIAHDPTNIEHGHGGPSDPDLHYAAADLEEDLRDQLGSGSLVTRRSDRVAREVDTDDGPAVAWDVVFSATRRPVGQGGYAFGS